MGRMPAPEDWDQDFWQLAVGLYIKHTLWLSVSGICMKSPHALLFETTYVVETVVITPNIIGEI